LVRKYLFVRNRTHSNNLKENLRNLLGRYKAIARNPWEGAYGILELQGENKKEWELLSPPFCNLWSLVFASLLICFFVSL
jgi:hypothetical protein